MPRFLVCLGAATALIAAGACRSTPDSPLAEAAAANDAPAVRRLLAHGARADEPDDPNDTWSPLIWAARSGAVDVARLLLDHGAAVDRPDRTRLGWTPLQHAIHARQPAIVRLLLTRGADPNRSAAAGSLTPLLMAADAADPSTVSMLLQHGADPQAAGEDGDTPLSRAVAGGFLSDLDQSPLADACRAATVRALLAHDPTLRLPRNFAGHLALWLARVRGCDEVIELIGEPPTGSDRPIVRAFGRLRDAIGRTRPDVPPPPPATDDPLPR